MGKEIVNIRSDIKNLIEELRNYPYTVTQADDPLGLHIGFRCKQTNQIWLISLKDFKSSLAELDQISPERAFSVRKCFSTSEGKEILLTQINKGKAI